MDRDYGNAWSNSGILFRQTAPSTSLVRAMCDDKCHLSYDQLLQLGGKLGDRLSKPLTRAMSKRDCLEVIAGYAFGQGSDADRDAYVQGVLERDTQPNRSDMDVDETTECLLGFMDPADKEHWNDVERKVRNRRKTHAESHDKWQAARKRNQDAKAKKKLVACAKKNRARNSKATKRPGQWRGKAVAKREGMERGGGVGVEEKGKGKGKGLGGEEAGLEHAKGKGAEGGGDGKGKGKGKRTGGEDMSEEEVNGAEGLGDDMEGVDDGTQPIDRAEKTHRFKPWGSHFELAYRAATRTGKAKLTLKCLWHAHEVSEDGVVLHCQRNLELKDDTEETLDYVTNVLHNWAVSCICNEKGHSRRRHMSRKRHPYWPLDSELLSPADVLELRQTIDDL